MESCPKKRTFRNKKEENDIVESGFPPQTIEISSDEEEEDDGFFNQGDGNLQNYESAQKKLVANDPAANGGGAIEPAPTPINSQLLSTPGYMAPSPSSRFLPSVGAFTSQCAACLKWRLIPTKEKYEEIREYILEQPFVCEIAREWRPDISCDDPTDISPDGSRLWAIDKPNISRPPPGWERELHIRSEGSSKFADVYYVTPSGKRLRSMVEIQRYLLENPEYAEQGVTLSQFSFQTPKPLQEDYVPKRPRLSPSYHGTMGLP